MKKTIITALLCAAMCACVPAIHALANLDDFGQEQTESAQPIPSAQMEIGHRFYAYDTLEVAELPDKFTFGAQTVSVLDQTDPNTYLIGTYAGPKWVKLNLEYQKVVDPYKPYSYEQQIQDCFTLQNMYPDLIDAFEIGRSVEGRQIISVKLGKGNKEMIMVGSHHANEYISSAYIMKMIDEYAYAYYTTGVFGLYNIKELLDNVTLHLVVMLNPDGVNLVQNGPGAAANFDLVSSINMQGHTYGAWKANLNGVDLNRNYPAQWDVKVTTTGPSWKDFKGYAPASEPEIMTMMSYSLKNNFLLAASLHTKGEVLYWADRKTIDLIPIQKQVALAVAQATGYALLPISENPRIYAAGYENWFREQFLRPAFCIELTPQNGTGVNHNDADFDMLVWHRAKQLGAALAQQCLYIT